MKLVSYELGRQARLGVVQGKSIIGIRPVVDLLKNRKGPKGLANRPQLKNAVSELLDSRAPAEMIELLDRGEGWRKSLKAVVAALGKELDPAKAPKGIFTPLAGAKLLPPIARPGKITCIGLNYADHAREGGMEPPKSPIYFLKAANTICGPGDPILLPPVSSQVDYEAEFAVVIGKRGSRIPEEKAYEYVAGYTILHDVSARDMQFADGQWFRGKSCDSFAPTGPWIVTRDEIKDPHDLRISLTLNGETMQDSSTSNLIFKVPYLVSYLSQSATWEPGDLISTGTPPGVGFARKPPVFLKAGDSVSVSVEKIGTLTNPVGGSSD